MYTSLDFKPCDKFYNLHLYFIYNMCYMYFNHVFVYVCTLFLWVLWCSVPNTNIETFHSFHLTRNINLVFKTVSLFVQKKLSFSALGRLLKSKFYTDFDNDTDEIIIYLPILVIISLHTIEWQYTVTICMFSKQKPIYYILLEILPYC